MQWLFPFFLLVLIGCRGQADRRIPFSFDVPDEVIKLPGRLHEISGITFYSKNKLACIQDEKGIVFIYDLKKDKVKDNIRFASNHDYEAIANVNDTIYVLSSNGELTETSNLESEEPVSVRYTTFLTKENNCEGLCYDAANRRLLIACKGQPKKENTELARDVYSFNLETKQLDLKPAYTIYPDSVYSKIYTSSFFNWRADHKFAPSEISIDPLTGQIYLLSSVGKILVVLTADGNVRAAVTLDPKIYAQPEGLAFSKEGALYISDEGKDHHATLICLKRVK